MILDFPRDFPIPQMRRISSPLPLHITESVLFLFFLSFRSQAKAGTRMGNATIIRLSDEVFAIKRERFSPESESHGLGGREESRKPEGEKSRPLTYFSPTKEVCPSKKAGKTNWHSIKSFVIPSFSGKATFFLPLLPSNAFLTKVSDFQV